MKTIIGLAIGIILAAAVLIPLNNARTQAELETQRTKIALETAQAENEALKAAQMPETPTEATTETSQNNGDGIITLSLANEPQKVTETATVEEITETPVVEETTTTPEPTEVEEAKKTAETQATPTVEPTAEPTATQKPEQTSSPQVKQTPEPAEYPKYFYIDGQKYAYLTAYAEEMGRKTFIADESEPNAIQEGSYNWTDDPNGKIPGPFNGN